MFKNRNSKQSAKHRQKLVIANWKMNPDSLKEAKKNFSDFKKYLSRHKNIDKNVTTVFCPPVQYIFELKKMYKGNKIFFGAQNVSSEKDGAHTGEISVSMLKDLGAHFVIVGHSERRAIGETNEMISKKVKTALSAGLHTILCVGEQVRDLDGKYLKELSQQVIQSLEGISKDEIKKLIIAYEPVWAIGEGKKPMEGKDMHFISLFIQKQLIQIFNRKIASETPIIYGGSIDSENVRDFIKEFEGSGLLVGRASLNPSELLKIISQISF